MAAFSSTNIESIMNLTVKLPTLQCTLEHYRIQGNPLDVVAPSRPFNRIAYSAAHVVADPLNATDLGSRPAIDWKKTIEYRRYLLGQGLGIAEAMDTAQRGMGLPWESALELVARTLAETSDIPGARDRSSAGIRREYLRRRHPRVRHANRSDSAHRQPHHPDGEPGAREGRAHASGLSARVWRSAFDVRPAGHPALAR
jgi:hypothetical protein